jgi:uncharacterized protein (TIGR00730 family)
MAELRSICVYCGSNDGRLPDYARAAERLGRDMAEANVRLVYGGGSVGLMGIVARTVLAHGGKVTGIIPQFLKDREVMLKEVSELIVTADMHERKRIMFERSDAFVALPGGIGTLEEVVEMMTWAQLDQHEKPILIVNVNGFWDPLVAQFGRMTEEGFLHKAFLGDHVDLPVRFCGSAEAVVPTLKAALAALPRPELEESRGVRAM